MILDDHVFTIGLQHAAVGAGLAEDFADSGEVKPHCISKAEAFGEAGRVDIHHHVHQRLELGGAAGVANVFVGDRHGVEDRLSTIEGLLFAAAH